MQNQRHTGLRSRTFCSATYQWNACGFPNRGGKGVGCVCLGGWVFWMRAEIQFFGGFPLVICLNVISHRCQYSGWGGRVRGFYDWARQSWDDSGSASIERACLTSIFESNRRRRLEWTCCSKRYHQGRLMTYLLYVTTVINKCCGFLFVFVLLSCCFYSWHGIMFAYWHLRCLGFV